MYPRVRYRLSQGSGPGMGPYRGGATLCAPGSVPVPRLYQPPPKIIMCEDNLGPGGSKRSWECRQENQPATMVYDCVPAPSFGAPEPSAAAAPATAPPVMTAPGGTTPAAPEPGPLMGRPTTPPKTVPRTTPATEKPFTARGRAPAAFFPAGGAPGGGPVSGGSVRRIGSITRDAAGHEYFWSGMTWLPVPSAAGRTAGSLVLMRPPGAAVPAAGESAVAPGGVARPAGRAPAGMLVGAAPTGVSSSWWWLLLAGLGVGAVVAGQKGGKKRGRRIRRR